MAIADAVLRDRPLSGANRDSSVLLEGVLLMALLSLAAAGIIAGDRLVFGVGLWTTAIFAGAIGSFWLIQRHTGDAGWRPRRPAAPPRKGAKPEDGGARLLGRASLIARTAVLAIVILVAGIALARTGDALALQTGLGASFVGVALVAVATSLPEVSTTIGAIRLGAYTMASPTSSAPTCSTPRSSSWPTSSTPERRC